MNLNRKIKLEIEIELYKNNSLNIKVNYIDNRIFYAYSDYNLRKYYVSEFNIFTIYIYNLIYPNGVITESAFMLPINKKCDNRKVYNIERNFTTDSERKRYLKKLYYSLNDWSKNYILFYKDKKHRFDIIDNKWILSYTL